MYRCSICQTASKPGAKLRRLTLKKNRQITAEHPACDTCHAMYEAGVPLPAIHRQRGQPPVRKGTAPAPQPKAAPPTVVAPFYRAAPLAATRVD